MDKGLEEKREFKSMVAGIKRIADDPKGLGGNTYDSYKEDLSIKGNAVKKNINDFTSKAKGKTQNKKDIFGDIVDTVDGFLGTDNEDTINSNKKPYIQSKVLRYAKQAAQKSLQITQQLITDEVKKGFFSGQGGCDSNSETRSQSFTMSPTEFDFINMLKVSPDSISGKVMYEAQPDPGLGLQFNRELFTAFDETPYDFVTKDGDTLFRLVWSPASQKYAVVNISSDQNISDFISDYYNTIEQPDIEGVLKNAMLMSLQGDGTEPSSFNSGMDYLNRLLTKLFSLCGNASNNDSPFLNNATNQLFEDEPDIQDYFDFDDVEGIDLDDEDARKRRVLKFADCNNFEIPTNSNHMEDFTYLLDSKNIDENVNNTLKKAAMDAYGQSDESIYLEGFELSLMNDYILQIPRALVSTILSPKMLFPIALSYQMLNADVDDLNVKDMMKELSGMFFSLIKSLFWNFIKEFWALVKRDLLNFVKDVATTIVLNTFNKIKGIILSLISLLLKVLESGIQSCADIFGALLNVIKSALNRSVSVPIPGLLLVISQSLPGFSADRAYMDSLDRLEAAGINTGDIYGTENKLPSLMKSMIESYSNEMDANSYVKVGLNPTIIPAGPGGAVISPLITGAGKLF